MKKKIEVNRLLSMQMMPADELYQVHRLIKHKSTGTPQQLAQKLNCSESSVFRKIKRLREDYFLPIEYCNVRGCYYYDGDVSIDFTLTINGEQMAKIIGGADTIKNIDIFSALSKNESDMIELCSCIWPIQNRTKHL